MGFIQRTRKIWYPSPRFYMVPTDCAAELGKAIIAAAKGETHGEPPGWWFDFDKQYQAGEWRTRQEPTTEVEPEDEWEDAMAELPLPARFRRHLKGSRR